MKIMTKGLINQSLFNTSRLVGRRKVKLGIDIFRLLCYNVSTKGNKNKEKKYEKKNYYHRKSKFYDNR